MVCNCKGLLLATLVLCGWLGAIHPAQSADLGPQLREQLAEPAPPPSQWQFSFTPYGWMININGNVTARGHTVDVNENFFQIVEKSNSLMALMGYFEARKGPFAFFTDVVFADLGFPGHLQVQRDIVTKLGPTIGIKLKAHAQLDYTSTISSHGVAYEIARWPSRSGSGFTALDAMGSFRYWNSGRRPFAQRYRYCDSESSRLGLVLQRSGSRAIAKSGTLEWVDPVVGGRVRHEIAPGKELSLEGDVGGFGAGSQFSWQVVAAYGYDTMCFGMPLHAVIGYRALSVDFSDGGPHGKNGLDFVEHGPLLGATFRW